MIDPKEKISFDEICAIKNIKLTMLRKEILSILFHKNKPMGAYEILEKLKKKRSSAEPPTVYRVLKWLVDAHLIHRIEAQNTYVLCSIIDEKKQLHKTILLFCNNCHKSYEYEDAHIFNSIKKFIEKYQIEIDETLIEMKGLCTKCHTKASQL